MRRPMKWGWRLAMLVVAAVLSVPAQGAEPDFRAEPPQPVLGRTERVELTFRIPGEDTGQVRVAVNVGTLSLPSRVGPGRYRASYTPPATRFPQAALLLAWHDGPDAQVAFYRLPLLGTTRLPVTTNPDTEVRVQVADATFGPVRTDANGAATVPLEVPPGVLEAEVRVGTAKSGRKVALEVPPYNRLVAAVVPSALVADGKAHARVDVYFESRSGDPVRPSELQVTPTLGEATLIDAGTNRVRYRYQPPRMTAQTEARISVSHRGRPASASEARVSLRPPRPRGVTLTASEPTLLLGARKTVRLVARVSDENGGPVAGLQVRLLEDGREGGELKDDGTGAYVLDYAGPERLPRDPSIPLIAQVKDGPSSAPVALKLEVANTPVSVRVAFAPPHLPRTAGAEADLELRLLDLAGRPATASSLRVSAKHGRISGLKFRERGLWTAHYRAPDELPREGDMLQVSAEPALSHEQRIPLGVADYTLAVGGQLGFIHSLGSTFSPTLAVEAWLPVRLGGRPLGAGAVLQVAGTNQRFQGGGPPVEGSALWVPLSLRGGYELGLNGAASVQLGLQLTAAPARFTSELTPAALWNVGVGAGLFATALLPMGPGQLLGDLSLSTLPLQGPDFGLQGAGLSLRIGYRHLVGSHGPAR